MNEWKPIDTAPRDFDQYILVCSHDVMVGHDGKPFELYWCDVVQWIEIPGRELGGGWHNGDCTQGPDHYDYWQPLPPPPKQKSPVPPMMAEPG